MVIYPPWGITKADVFQRFYSKRIIIKVDNGSTESSPD
ncbi:Hypothetical protein CpMEX30_1458 [Corynebacterium pseudotuberculosis]|nr:Hypothetical protein Cp3995_1431 [Corynebacterium pseudotuberculosis 3/99-5]AFH52347.1 Hypothetical protein Cp267_1450 [Corynebacterium pseudotuberculosis 267]AIG07807.1 hypothetical protein CPTA_01978 [Corynebacterium pseudotuberculosis]AIG09839.1 hypothetical protein CPTB_01783 [Corynebacterium pseudotuberculosis]AKJ56068.1 Hypothetical protein Cp12C_1465 [Corynebacterium pseudotuberculosis]